MKIILNLTDMHIDTPSNSVPVITVGNAENAATKIQAGFRGYRVRKQLKENATTPTVAASENSSKTNIPQVTIDRCIDDTNILEEKSATKIQAGVRGFLVRQKQKIVNDAATKIQAGFRGFKTRRDLQQKNLADPLC